MNHLLTTYEFSITKGSLLVNDAWIICQDYLSSLDWDTTKERVRLSPEFSHVKEKTFQTKFGLIKNRVDALPIELWQQIDEIHDFTWLLYLSTCVRHQIFGDFVLEVVREEYLILQSKLTEDHYRTYLYSKMDDHPEVEQLKENTQVKIRQNFMRILSEVGLIHSTRNPKLQGPIMSDYMINLISKENKLYLKYFLLSDFEIESL